MSEPKRLPRTKREFATIYRKVAARVTSPGNGIRLWTYGEAGQCGEGTGCLGGQFMAVSGAVASKFCFDWYPSANRLMTKSLSLAIMEDPEVGPMAKATPALSKFIVSFNDVALRNVVPGERDRVTARILRRAAYLLDHGGEI